MRIPPLAATLSLFAFILACGDYDDGGVDATPAAVQAISGGNQSGTVGQALANPIGVRVVDGNGNGVSGIEVEFVAQGGGSVAAASVAVPAAGAAPSASRVPVTTDESGQASVLWTLGTAAGDQTVTATVGGYATQLRTTFSATAQPDEADNLLQISGDDQTGDVGVALNPFVVQVVDQFENGVPGETVEWAINFNPGTLSETATTTGADGMTSSIYTPDGPGDFQVVAGVGDVDAVAFNGIIDAPAGPAEAASEE